MFLEGNSLFLLPDVETRIVNINKWVMANNVEGVCDLILGNEASFMAAQSKASVWGRSLAGIAGSNPAGGIDVRLLWISCVEVTATSWSLVQGSPIDCVCVRVRVCQWVWSGATITLYAYNV
jgi:hypothetical protein